MLKNLNANLTIQSTTLSINTANEQSDIIHYNLQNTVTYDSSTFKRIPIRLMINLNRDLILFKDMCAFYEVYTNVIRFEFDPYLILQKYKIIEIMIHEHGMLHFFSNFIDNSSLVLIHVFKHMYQTDQAYLLRNAFLL